MAIVRNEIDNETVCLYLYGEIGKNKKDDTEYKLSSENFARDLECLEKNYQNIIIRVNSEGGDVYEGIAIFNSIRSSKANITIRVDGIAASIAGIICLCGKRVEMSKYARLMIHNVKGAVWGDKNDLAEYIKTIEELEDMLSDIISSRCGKTKENVKEMYFDGKDHWFNSEAALKEHLIDSIYDVEAIPVDSTKEDIYRIFTNRLISETKNQDNMNLEECKKIPRFANCASEEEVLNEMKTTAEKADNADKLELENKELKQQIEDSDKKVIEEAITQGKIDASQKETYSNLLKADRTNTLNAIHALKPKMLVKNLLGTKPQEPELGAWDRKMAEIRNKMER